MALKLEYFTPKDLRNTLKQTRISFRELSKVIYPEKGEDYLSHKIREGSFSLPELIKIKNYIDQRFEEGFFDLCHRRYNIQSSEKYREKYNKISIILLL